MEVGAELGLLGLIAITDHGTPKVDREFFLTEDNPGDWLYHCHVTDHMMGGMVGRYIAES
ncbi:MAG: multicopper oxidase domain-containing protein [Catenulispora sp.]|nr:multicopper oxidase domain-containing protein [Catenulispora sp.]